MKGTTFVFILTLIAGLGYLIYLAMEGENWATGILFSLWSIFCVMIGAGIVQWTNHLHAKQETARFNANMQENLSNALALQRLQNEQAKGLTHLSRIQPSDAGRNQPPAFLIDDGIFDELEEN